MKKISFAGAYGIHSQGDDAALISMVEGLRKRIGDFDGVVITRHAQENPYAPYKLRSIQNLEYDCKFKELKQEIASSDLLILGAGNFLIDITIDLFRGPIPLFMILTLIAKMTGTPVMWYGLSVGPFRTTYGREVSKLAASLADAITVRDQRSYVELQRLDYKGSIVELPDPVLGLRPASVEIAKKIPSWRKAHQKSNLVIAISVRNMPSGSVLEPSEFIEKMAVIGDNLISHYNAALLFIPQCTYQHGNANEDDRNIAKWITERMQHKDKAVIVDEELTVDQCLSLYNGTRLALCTRLHANVYAAIQGIPSVAISYNPKVAEFMKWVEHDDLIVSLSELSPTVILDKVEHTLAKHNELSNAMLTKVSKGRTKVEQYADIVCKLISGSTEKL